MTDDKIKEVEQKLLTLLKKECMWAVYCVPNEKVQPLSTEAVAYRLTHGFFPDDIAKQNGWAWVNCENLHHLSEEQIDRLFPLFPEEVAEILGSSDNSAQLESEGDTVFGALSSYVNGITDEELSISTWRFVLEPDLLMTTSCGSISSLDLVYKLIRRRMVFRSPAEIVDRILLEFAVSLRRDFAYLDDDLDKEEDVLLKLKPDTDLGRMGGNLGLIRRRSTELHRILAPIHRIFQHAELDLPEWAADDLTDSALRQINAALDDLLALRDRARSLQDELTSNQVEETNRRLYILTIGTILMLPATVVTGFFGMNTGGMFLSTGPWGTVEAGGVCMLMMVGTWLILKWAKLF